MGLIGTFRLKRRRVWLAAGAFSVVAVLGLLAGWFFPQQILCLDTGPGHGEVLVVLGGGSGERADRAAELFKAGVAPRILLSGAGDAQDNRRLLVARGVPAEAIEIEGNSKSTRQNAQFTVRLLRAEGVRRAVIVTSWYHSRRAYRCFRKSGPELEFLSRPAYYGYESARRARPVNWFIWEEYVKLAGYWVCYGVWPF